MGTFWQPKGTGPRSHSQNTEKWNANNEGNGEVGEKSHSKSGWGKPSHHRKFPFGKQSRLVYMVLLGGLAPKISVNFGSPPSRSIPFRSVF